MKAVLLGGTGSLGKALTRKLLARGTYEIVCVSRDELKQKQMAEEFGHNSRIRFVLGDIRDRASCAAVMDGADVVFLLAALKHVDSAEENPEESVKTNILGTINVAECAIAAKVPIVVFSSTDKAVAPANVYGMCKGISERIFLNKNKTQKNTSFSVFRWGNVLGSRGSVLSVFAKTLKERKRVYVTDTRMTRFWITIDEAAEFMLENLFKSSGVMIPPIKAAPVLAVADAVAKVMGVGEYDVVPIGIRPGEKLHEEIDKGVFSDDWKQFTAEELQGTITTVLRAGA